LQLPQYSLNPEFEELDILFAITLLPHFMDVHLVRDSTHDSESIVHVVVNSIEVLIL
jgi:hypothetical protein